MSPTPEMNPIPEVTPNMPVFENSDVFYESQTILRDLFFLMADYHDEIHDDLNSDEDTDDFSRQELHKYSEYERIHYEYECVMTSFEKLSKEDKSVQQQYEDDEYDNTLEARIYYFNHLVKELRKNFN